MESAGCLCSSAHGMLVCSAEALAKDVPEDLVRLVMCVFNFLGGEVAEFCGDWVGAGPVGVLGCDGTEEHGYRYTCPVNELC